MNRIQFLKQLMGGIAIILLNPTKLFAKPETPSIELELTQSRVVANPRKLKSEWRVEPAEDLNCISFLTDEELQEFQKDIDEYILKELYSLPND
jgi:hypothetical protein